MARYSGPVCRICRREGNEALHEGLQCYYRRKMHLREAPHAPASTACGGARSPNTACSCGREQKVRRTYQLMETQFSATSTRRSPARRCRGDLLRLLETRSRQLVYRMGFATSRGRPAQMGRHGHFAVNGRPTDIRPSRSAAAMHRGPRVEPKPGGGSRSPRRPFATSSNRPGSRSTRRPWRGPWPPPRPRSDAAGASTSAGRGVLLEVIDAHDETVAGGREPQIEPVEEAGSYASTRPARSLRARRDPGNALRRVTLSSLEGAAVTPSRCVTSTTISAPSRASRRTSPRSSSLSKSCASELFGPSRPAQAGQ